MDPSQRLSRTERPHLASTPLLSVVVPTFQQKDYIRQCLSGILMQNTTFPIEVLVGDDGSLDGTNEICSDYARTHPGLIRFFQRRQDQRSPHCPPGRENLMGLLSIARGKYIARCDGDDYWTDPLKLQKQVDYLEKNADASLCFHPVAIVNNEGTIVEDYITKVPPDYGSERTFALKGNYIHTPTAVVRNYFNDPPPELWTTPMADFFLWSIAATRGRLHFMPEIMAHYRTGGTWSSRSRHERVISTAICHSIMHKWAWRTGRQDLAAIYQSRISQTINSQRKQLTPADLNKFQGLRPEISRIVSRARRQILIGRIKDLVVQRARPFYLSLQKLVGIGQC